MTEVPFPTVAAAIRSTLESQGFIRLLGAEVVSVEPSVVTMAVNRPRCRSGRRSGEICREDRDRIGQQDAVVLAPGLHAEPVVAKRVLEHLPDHRDVLMRWKRCLEQALEIGAHIVVSLARSIEAGLPE